MRKHEPRWITGLATVAALMLVSAPAHAQKIPDVFVGALGAILLAPILAVPVKLGVARLVHAPIPVTRVWALCLVEWFLWIPGAFVVVRLIGFPGAGFGILGLLGISAWLHRKSALASSGTGHATLAIGALLAALTPAIAIALPMSVLGVSAFLASLAA